MAPTLDEFKRLPKNTTLYAVSWMPGMLMILRCLKRGEADSDDLYLSFWEGFGIQYTDIGGLKFREGEAFLDKKEATAKLHAMQDDPPSGWINSDEEAKEQKTG